MVLLLGRIKVFLRNREIALWTLGFPIILSTLFSVACGGLMSTGQFSPISVAVVDNQDYRESPALSDTLTAISEGDDRLFSLHVVSNIDEADNLLSSGEISGYIIPADTPSLAVKNSGINETVIKSFLDNFISTSELIEQIATSNPEAVSGAIQKLQNPDNYISAITLSDSEYNSMLPYFYALISMTAIYGCFWGLLNTTHTQANQSPLGARRSVAPTHKFRLILTDSFAAVIIHFSIIMIVLCYIIFVLGVNLVAYPFYVILTCFIGAVSGISLGTLIGTLKFSEGVKVAILISTSMLLSFLAGLMIGGIKYQIEKHIPILSLINPVARISDAFYCLYMFGPNDRFFMNIIILCVFSAVFSLLSFVILRRQRYASI